MKKYEENIKEYEEICGKYEGISPLLRGTWKNSERSLPIQVLRLKNIPSFLPLFKFWDLKNSEPSLPVEALVLVKIPRRAAWKQDSKDMKIVFIFSLANS